MYSIYLEYQDEDEYYDDEDEDENMRFQPTNKYEKDLSALFSELGQLCGPVMFTAKGELSGDINWNNAQAQLELHIPYSITKQSEHDAYLVRYKQPPRWYQFSATVAPFTGNCGVKAIAYVSHQDVQPELSKLWIKILESFLYYCCNCGIVVSSDWTNGSTANALQTYGVGYTITDPVWNPNYSHTRDHKIQLMYKYLDKNALTDYWG